jgi:hypothetical protein
LLLPINHFVNRTVEDELGEPVRLPHGDTRIRSVLERVLIAARRFVGSHACKVLARADYRRRPRDAVLLFE